MGGWVGGWDVYTYELHEVEFAAFVGQKEEGVGETALVFFLFLFLFLLLLLLLLLFLLLLLLFESSPPLPSLHPPPPPPPLPPLPSHVTHPSRQASD